MDALVPGLEGGGGERLMLVFLLVSARIAPVALIAPWLVFRGTATSLRLAVALALAGSLLPLALASASGSLPTTPWPFALLLAKEAVVGGVFALASSLPFLAFGWAGSLVDRARGFHEGMALGGESSSPLGALHLLAAAALFAALGGHRLALSAFAEGLVDLPVGALAVESGLSAGALAVATLVGRALFFALALALPSALALAIVEIAFGVVARAMPGFPAAFAALPLRAVVGIGVALLGLSFALAALPDAFRDAFAAATRLVSGFRP